VEIITVLIDSLKYFIPAGLINGLIIFAFILFLIGWVVPKLISWFQIGRRFWNRVSNLLDITNEFKNNGGSSIKDAIDNIGYNVVKISSEISILSGKLNSVFYVVGEESGVAVFEADVSGKVIYACRRWLEMTSLSTEESKGHGWQNAIFEADKDRVIKTFDEAVEDGIEFYIHYSIYNRLNNQIIPVKSYSLIIRDSAGQPIRYLIVVAPENEKISS